MLPIPWYLKIVVALALRLGLRYVENHFGPEVAQKVRDILKYLGLLGGVAKDEVAQRVHQVHSSCDMGGIGCPPTLKFS